MFGSVGWAASAATSLLLVALTAPPSATASSHRPPILHPRALSHPHDVRLQIIQRGQVEPHLQRRQQVTGPPVWSDSWLLSFSSHGQPFTLSLRPSTTLVHPQGIKLTETFTDLDGTRTTTTRRLERAEALVYEGVVVPEDADLEQWVREEAAGLIREPTTDSWARIVVIPPGTGADDHDHDDEDGTGAADEEVRFQGAFALGEDLYTVHSTPRYLATREPEDPEPPLLHKRTLFGSTLAHPSMVVVRERDILTRRDEDASSAAPASTGCGHDHLSFNVDPSHPVFENTLDQAVFEDLSTPWHTLFGLPVRQAPTTSTFSLKDRSTVLDSFADYPPRPRLSRRQADIGGASNASSNFINSIGSTAGCPKSAMVVFVGVAADCTYTSHYTSADLARTQILTDFNSASSLYASTFNVSLGIVELNVQSGTCPTTASAVDTANPWNVGCQEGGGPGLSLNDRLSTFSQWRGDKGGSDGAGLWHLMTNCSTGSEVGVAWLGQLCRVAASSSQGQTTSGTGVTAITRSEWQVVAHEIGHNFGAIHDCRTGCTLTNSNPVCCPLTTTTCDADANYIMSPVSSKNTTAFSPCSIGNICSTLSASLNTTCLATPGASSNPPLISLQSCGNGIVEDDEECDAANDPCCDSATCRFVAGAVCSSVNSLCCNQCQIASAGTVCRAAVDDQCDREETCDGSSAQCPADAFTADGTSCGSNGLACATGVCTSRDVQCQTAGASLGLSTACPLSATSTCSITCDDPTRSNGCIILDQSFRDGSPCGYAGRCRNSECASGSALDTAKSWYRENLRISIPVTVVVGILVILLLWALIRCCFCRRKPKPVKAASGHFVPAPPMQGQYYGNSNNQYPPPPPPQHPSRYQQQQQFAAPPASTHSSGRGVLRRGDGNGYSNGGGNGGGYGYPPQNGNQGWVDPTNYNGANYGR